jgi:hypothetical protein
MPRLRLPGTVSPPKSTLHRWPDHVQAIGMISVEIANLEIMLGELLASLLHIDRHYGHVVYLTPQAALGRLAILRNVIQDTLEKETSGRQKLDDIVSRANGVILRRHELIHNSWGVAPDNPRRVLRRSLPNRENQPAKAVILQELTDLIETIRELSDHVRRTTDEVFSEWPPYTWKEAPIVPASPAEEQPASAVDQSGDCIPD